MFIAYWLFFRKGKDTKDAIVQSNPDSAIEEVEIIEDSEEDILVDKNGLKYKNVLRSKDIPRKTFLIGTIYGKYWGEVDEQKGSEYERFKFYNFNIYEAIVKTSLLNTHCSCITPLKPVCEGIHTEFEGKFDFQPDSNFPIERLPHTISCTIIVNGATKDYSIVIHEPELRNINFSRKLHQNEGKEIFGTINAEITGYILDFIKEEYIDKEYIAENTEIQVQKSVTDNSKLSETLTPTGNTQYKDGYQRTEYFYSDYKSRYWGKWKYKRSVGSTTNEGCLSYGIGILGAIIGITFLLLLLPRIILILPFIFIPLLFRIIPALAWSWLFRIIGVFLLMLFILSLLTTFRVTKRANNPKPTVYESIEERKTEYNPVVDTIKSTIEPDTLITHFRDWQDYKGNKYQGKFWVKNSSLVEATSFKNNLNVIIRDEKNYDEMIFSLKENDKGNLAGIYQLFDSIRNTNNFTKTGFAEMVVSFVQDIPYSIVLPNDCDPSLYSDDFVRNYLASSDARCDGYQKYGINSPVEFLATLQGDCDTRTLLIYTLLAHYGYDIAILSSEYYNHSIIGINLPYDGVAYKYNTQRYAVWETTAPRFTPGILPKEISNIDYWRISLKSK